VRVIVSLRLPVPGEFSVRPAYLMLNNGAKSRENNI